MTKGKVQVYNLVVRRISASGVARNIYPVLIQMFRQQMAATKLKIYKTVQRMQNDQNFCSICSYFYNVPF
jgi:hypothetical protein